MRLYSAIDPRGEGEFICFGEQEAALVLGDLTLAKHHKTRVQERLAEIEKHIPMEIEPAAPKRNKTLIKNLKLAPDLETAFDKEKIRALKMDDADLIDARTGRRLGKSGLAKKRQEKKAKASESDSARTHDIEDIHSFKRQLNDLSPNRFTKRIKRTVNKVGRHCLESRKSGHKACSGVPEHVVQVLEHTQRHPVPLYKATDRTLRLSPFGLSLAQLPKAWRRHLFEDCLEIDADSIQLALAAALWDLPTLQGILSTCTASEQTWWDVLHDYLEQAFPQADLGNNRAPTKAICKTMTYSMVFGMSERNLRRLTITRGSKAGKARFKSLRTDVRKHFGVENVETVTNRILAHPAFQELLKARKELFRAIRRDRGIRDGFGRWIPLRTQNADEPRNVSSMLSDYMQAAEMMAMLPVGKEALGNSTMLLYLWQHDGITVRPKKTDRPSRYRKTLTTLQSAFQKGLKDVEDAFGCKTSIQTQLSVDYCPSAVSDAFG
ncbi:hypothetical protein [Salisaeta longa]|uniref:hypothetical protein n=1 Tax=Salisaeta longa TaxID=503170 RepID=UPI0003B5F553|nr:hypothetical protein [Salisaeta longa]